MKRIIRNTALVAAAALVLIACGTKPRTPLKDALKDKFLIGTAMNAQQIRGIDTAGIRIIKYDFNSIVAENCMKPEELQPVEGEFTFDLADKFIEFGEQNNMAIIGHTLVWHSQLPRWFTRDEEGNDVTREVLLERMRTHISTVVGRYKGRVHGWDVVNEAINDDGSWRNSPFYRIIGEDFIEYAFTFANEADPDAELYYNDYSMALPGRREAVVNMIRNLKEKGIRIDAIGMQAHLGMDYPELSEFEKSIQAFIAEGVNVMITEFDVSALPSSNVMGANITDMEAYQAAMNPYTDGLPQEVSDAWNERMKDIFRLLFKYSDNVTRVTFWGVADGDSWKNGFPIRGRTDYPLLFDRQHNPKPIVWWLSNREWK